MLKTLVVLVLGLVSPTVAWGATMYEVTSNGQSAMQGMPVQDVLRLDITLTLDESGAAFFGGALIGPSGLTITGRTYCSLVADNLDKWSFIVNDDVTYLEKPLSAALDFGAMEIGGTGAELPAGATTLMSIEVSGLASLPPSSYPLVFQVGNSSDIAAGAWWSVTGEPILVDSSVPFVIGLPEPATMFLLAGALPFFRRRVA